MNKKMLSGIAIVLSVVCVAGSYTAIKRNQQVKAYNNKVAEELHTIENFTVKEGESLPDLRSAFDETTTIDKNSINADIQNVDVTVPGNYDIVFNFRDEKGQERQKTVTCTVLANLKDHVMGMDDITVDYGENLPEANLTYDDYIDSVVRDDSAVDIMTPGTYPLIYSILGKDGEMEDVEYLATVLDTRPVEITPTPESKGTDQDHKTKNDSPEVGNVDEPVLIDQVVKTGDDSHVLGYLFALTVSFAGGFISMYLRKKTSKRNKF